MSQDPTRAAQDVDASSSACLTCEHCVQPIQTVYWAIGGKLICASCRAALDALKDPPLDRATWRRVLVSGGSAALLGALIHLVIVALTGSEYGFAALGVGLLVGGAVRKAAAGCGGIKLQIVAMAMTYVAVVTAYVPAVLTGFGSALDEHRAEKLKTAGTAAGQGGAVASVQTAGSQAPESAPAAAQDEPVSFGAALIGGVFVVVMAFAVAAAVPWLMVADSPFCLLILAVALYQAWRLNVRARPVCRGPFAAWQNLPG